MKKLILFPRHTFLFLLPGIIIILNGCKPGATKDFEVKGNVMISNNCGGTIPDTIIVKFYFYDDKNKQLDKDTALVIRKDEFYPFHKTSNVNEDSKRCRIITVTDFNGKPICEAARKVKCKAPQKCKGTLSNVNLVDIGELMLCDVSCNCSN